MWSVFGHLVLWYMVMNVLDEYFSGSVFIGCQKMEAVFPDQNLGNFQSDYTVPEPRKL
jgi:hypothetical protein